MALSMGSLGEATGRMRSQQSLPAPFPSLWDCLLFSLWYFCLLLFR